MCDSGDRTRRGGDTPTAESPIVLLGLMGAGKTTVGRVLADRLHRSLSDSDVGLAAATGLTARALKTSLGADELHRLEAEHLLGALAAPGPQVICAAASVVEVATCRDALLGPGVFTVWLRATPQALAARFLGGPHRPIYGADALRSLELQLRERGARFARVADLQVDSADATPAQVADEIVAALSAPGPMPDP